MVSNEYRKNNCYYKCVCAKKHKDAAWWNKLLIYSEIIPVLIFEIVLIHTPIQGHIYWPLCSLLLWRERKWMAENETEAHVFTLAQWAASELHGNGQSTFSVEKAPLWLTEPARLWGSGLTAPNINKKQENMYHKIGYYPLKVKGCMQQGLMGCLLTACNSCANEGSGMPRTSQQSRLCDCLIWQCP